MTTSRPAGAARPAPLLALCASLLSGSALVLLGPAEARACASLPTVEELTTFDPAVLGEQVSPDLYFDPDHLGFGAPDPARLGKLARAEWEGFLGAPLADDWMRLLASGTTEEIDGLIFLLKGKKGAQPGSFATSALVRPAPDKKERLIASLFYAGYLRRLAPWTAELSDEGPAPDQLFSGGEGALARQKEPFLQQRYAYLLQKLRFYRKRFPEVIARAGQQGAALAGPSPLLAGEAQHYLAGALLRSGQRARGNLELARLLGADRSREAQLATEFQPMEEKDWQQSLQLAAGPAEKALLWHLVGLRADALVAAGQILLLDAGSDLVPLLLVRELSRLEWSAEEGLRETPDKAALEASRGKLEALALQVAKTPKASRPAVAHLVAAHLAALRGDLAAARARSSAATAAAPENARVKAQASASLALALARSYRPGDAAAAAEMAGLLTSLDPAAFSRSSSTVAHGRKAAAEACRAQAAKVEAELLVPAPTEGARPPPPSDWQDPAFVAALLTRVTTAKGPYETFLASGSGLTAEKLRRELAFSRLRRGEAAAALREFQSGPAASDKLGTDPFVIHLRDCHDCDQEKYANAPWTHRSTVQHMAELEEKAAGTGEPAARAALELGNAYYNLTWYGNARTLFGDTHQKTADTRPAEAAYKRAFEKSQDRELKAQAAFLAAKCERARLLEDRIADGREDDQHLPVPTVWYGELAKLADTSYHREVLRECASYRRWKR